MRPLQSTITAHTDETGATFLEYGLLITLVGLRRRRCPRPLRSQPSPLSTPTPFSWTG